MSTATRTGHAVDERFLRIPAITADLLPSEVVESRRTRHVRRIVLAAVACFAVLLAAWYAGTVQKTHSARAERDAAEQKVQNLTRLEHGYTEVVSVQAESDTVSRQLKALMATDLQWSRLFTSIHVVAPNGVTLTSIIASLNGPDDSNTGLDPALSGTTEKPVGTLTVTGNGPSKAVIAAYVDALAKVSGVRNPLLGEVNQLDKGLDFSVRMEIAKSALGGRFATASPSASGK